MSAYLHVWWLNLFPLRKHVFGVSTHSQAHFIGFSGWCFGQVFLQTHWHLSSSYCLFIPQEVDRSLFLQTHWQDVRSSSLWGPQLEGSNPPLQTHWQVSSSNSLFGPQISLNSSSESKIKQKQDKWKLKHEINFAYHISQTSQRGIKTVSGSSQ